MFGVELSVLLLVSVSLVLILCISPLPIPETAGAVLCHCWGLRNDVFIGTASNGLMHWDGSILSDVPLSFKSGVTSLLLARQHIIIGTAVRLSFLSL